jgi:hypothetical protein
VGVSGAAHAHEFIVEPAAMTVPASAEAKALVLAKRGARGRFQYLYCSCGAAVVLMLLLLLAHRYVPFHEIPIDLWLTAEAGLVGAVFSIAHAIKSRTVALDTEPLANATDGVLRLSIGVICAGVLVLLRQL